MLRPVDGLSAATLERLNLAAALGARETWIDRDELGLPEPSPLGRWVCVLEFPGFPLQAAGSSGTGTGVDQAAREALDRLDRLMSLVP